MRHALQQMQLATSCVMMVANAFPHHQRTAQLSLTPCPSVLSAPFFVEHRDDDLTYVAFQHLAPWLTTGQPDIKPFATILR